ncbi:MAG: ATP-binding protein [candidate division Zixibacteria bacterium]|nr:ATP-binding protein [candidate division Zixibacteria bacterium]
MVKLLIVVGLPGSGKSTFIENRLSKGEFPGTYFDEFMANAIDDVHEFKQSRHYGILIKQLQGGQNCVIADISFCLKGKRDEAVEAIREKVVAVDIQWKFFENSPAKCIKNVLRSGSPAMANKIYYINLFSGKYRIPDGIEAEEIWQEPLN